MEKEEEDGPSGWPNPNRRTDEQTQPTDKDEGRAKALDAVRSLISSAVAFPSIVVANCIINAIGITIRLFIVVQLIVRTNIILRTRIRMMNVLFYMC